MERGREGNPKFADNLACERYFKQFFDDDDGSDYDDDDDDNDDVLSKTGFGVL